MTLQELMTRWNGYQIEMRRWFHQHPEESTKEVRTAERIRAEFDRADIPWRPCGLGTGTLARIEALSPAARSFFAATSTRSPSTRRPDFPTRARFRASCTPAGTTATSRCCSRPQ